MAQVPRSQIGKFSSPGLDHNSLLLAILFITYGGLQFSYVADFHPEFTYSRSSYTSATFVFVQENL